MNNIDWNGKGKGYNWAVTLTSEISFSIEKPAIEGGYYHIGAAVFRTSDWDLTQRPSEPLIYTQEMRKTGKLPPIGSRVLLSVSKHSVASDEAKLNNGAEMLVIGHHEGLAVMTTLDLSFTIIANEFWAEPLDTRSDTEKAKDDLKTATGVSRCLFDDIQAGLVFGVMLDPGMEW